MKNTDRRLGSPDAWKRILAGTMAMVLGSATGVQAATDSFVAFPSGDFNENSSWNLSRPPNTGDSAFITNGATAILSSPAIDIGALTIGGDSILDIQAGGSLVAGTTTLQSAATVGTIDQSGGLFTPSSLLVGQSGNVNTASYLMSGGTLTTPTLSLGTGNTSRGTFTMTGGTVNATTFNIGSNNGSGSFSMSSGSVTVNGGNLFFNNAGSGTGSLSVSGGTFTLSGAGTIQNNFAATTKAIAVSGSGIFNAGGRTMNITGIEVSVSGGELNMQNAQLNIGATGSFTGGKITGVSQIAATSLNINGTTAEFHVGSNTAAASTTLINGPALTLTDGSMVFTAFGNNSADLLNRSGGSGLITLTSGTIMVDFDLGYTPQVGDSFNFIDWSGAGVSLSPSNIASLSYDGGWQIGWNTSQWTTTGILSIDTVTAVPEPQTFALLAGAFSLLVVMRRRRQDA